MVGVSIGVLAVAGLRRVHSAAEGLPLVGSVAAAALAFGAAGTLHGSGFLAAYLSGLVLGSARLPFRGAIHAFHGGLTSVAEIALFFALGLLAFPDQLGDVALEGTVLALVLAFIARPLAAALATALEGFSARERLVLGWAGLRGAVPVVLATFPILAGVPRSLEFFNLVLFAVLVSTLIQGATLEPLARRLGVTTREPALASSAQREAADRMPSTA